MNVVKKGWRQEMPAFLHFMEESLNLPVRLHDEALGYHLYLVDLSGWKLRFSDRTPLICVTEADLAALPVRELAQSLADVIRTRNLEDRHPILLVQGSGEGLRSFLRTALVPALVLDQAGQTAVQMSRRPSGELLDHLSAQLDLTALAPYETSKPVTGSRFFGREFEVRRMLQSPESNFAIMGIRRIGKTSLMREVERQLRDQALETGEETAQERIQFMDCSALSSPEDFMREVVRRLRAQELPRLSNRQYPIYFPDFLKRMAQRTGGRLVFFLDEFDKVLAWHRSDDALLNALRASSIAGDTRFIVGGFREVMRASSDLDSPLFNFARPLFLKEFSRDQTATMVLGPLESLGVHFDRRNEVVNRIYDETAGQPNLVQFYCSILVEELDRTGSRTVSPESLFPVYDNEAFRAFVLSTFMDNTTHLEKAIVFAILAEQGAEGAFGLEEVDSVLQRQGLQMPLSDLDHACQNLTLAGTFAARGRQHRFATPVFPRMLAESYDVNFLFRKVRQEGVW
jgi:hypothetical protein